MPRPLALLLVFNCFPLALAGGPSAQALEIGQQLAKTAKLTDASIKAFTAADDDVRKALFALHDELKFTDASRLAFCLFVLKKDPNDDVRAGAAGWLGKMKDNKSAQKLLADLLGEKSPALRQAACEGLIGVRGDPLLGPKFAKLAFDDSPKVRQAAVRAVGKLNDRTQISTVMAAYKKFKKGGDEDAAYGEALALLGETEVSLGVARACLKSRSFSARLAAIGAIECNPSMKAIPVIMENLVLELGRTIALDPAKKDWDIIYLTMCSELVRRTGKNFGHDAAAWHAWWDGVREKYKAPAPAFDEAIVARWMEAYLKMGPSKIRD
jgi:hypothetical protein